MHTKETGQKLKHLEEHTMNLSATIRPPVLIETWALLYVSLDPASPGLFFRLFVYKICLDPDEIPPATLGDPGSTLVNQGIPQTEPPKLVGVTFHCFQMMCQGATVLQW